MRKLETREDIEKKNNRNKLIIGIVLAVLLLMSTAGYAFFGVGEDESSKKIKYKTVEFSERYGFLMLELGGRDYYFNYLPNETSVFETRKILPDYLNKPLYFVGESPGKESVARNLGQIASRMQMACIEGEECDENLPVKNCSDNIVIFKQTDLSVIREEDNCVYILSNESLRDADAFIYGLLDVN